MGGPTAGSSARDLQKLRVKKGVIVAANTVGEQNRLWRMGLGSGSIRPLSQSHARLVGLGGCAVLG